MGISSALGTQALLPAGLGFRNKIINGDFRVWQRGTSVTTTVAYTADRWVQVSGNSIVHTQSTDVPNAGFNYSMSLSGTGSNIAQRIESLNCGGINGTITVSFWYKSTVGSDLLGMALYHCNTTDSFGSLTQIGSSITVSASPSSSWTYYQYVFTGVPANAKNGLALYLYRGSGATSTTLITGVQLEANSQPTPFEQRPVGVELALCQRYYQRTIDTQGLGLIMVGGIESSTGAAVGCTLPVTMRATPSMALGSGIRFYSAGSSTVTPTINSQRSSASFGSAALNITSGTVGQSGYLYNHNAANSYIEFSSEL